MASMAEYVVGHPIWTHQFADKVLVATIREEIFRQHPVLRDVEKYDAKCVQGDAVKDYIRGYVLRQDEKYGQTLNLEPMAQKTAN